MKQKIFTAVILFLTFLLLFFVVFGSRKNNNSIPDNKSKEEVLVEEGVDILYWGTTCPACHDTIDWIEENKIEEKIEIVRKEVYENEVNSRELIQKAKLCEYNENEIGIPFMFTKTQECLVGTPEISNYLRKEVDKLEGKNE